MCYCAYVDMENNEMYALLSERIDLLLEHLGLEEEVGTRLVKKEKK
jgi:hypothetical protein